MLELLFRSKAIVKVLGIVLFNEGLHLREIARKAGVSSSETKKELDKLKEAGVLNSEKRGNQIIFYLNKKCSFLQDLKNIYRKTEGVFSFLINEFELLNGIKFAFVFGSTAKGIEKKFSDIDLMLIGNIQENELIKSIIKVQKKTEREINYILWNEKDLIEKTNKNNSFFKNIVKNKKIWLKGDKDEFKRIAEKRNN
jgi:predicted nucleotidyltransferase